MTINEEDAVLYVPEHGDNRDLPEEDQMFVKIIPMTGGEFRAYSRSATMKNKKPNLEKIVEKILLERVLEIQNYSDIKNVVVTTAKEFFEQAEVALVDEVFSALTEISILKGGLRKK
tara:strand:+ start:601 stop:951 length:351 start_codon:yes stop_codon:yes gene_type:complete